MKRTHLFLSLGIAILIGNSGCNILKSNANNTDSNNSNSGNSNSKLSNTSANDTKIPFSSGPLLGKWSKRGLSSHTMEFKDDGMLTIVYNGKTIQDKYIYLSDTQIKDIDSKGKSRSPDFTVKGDEMTIIWTDTKLKDNSQHYIRVKPKEASKPKK